MVSSMAGGGVGRHGEGHRPPSEGGLMATSLVVYISFADAAR
ncbi:hypothetical protein [uncultured Microbacterium sp.]